MAYQCHKQRVCRELGSKKFYCEYDCVDSLNCLVLSGFVSSIAPTTTAYPLFIAAISLDSVYGSQIRVYVDEVFGCDRVFNRVKILLSFATIALCRI